MKMTALELSAILLSFRVAFLSLLINLLFAIPIAWLLVRKDFFGRRILESFLILPLVFPPVVTGYLLLVLLRPDRPLGEFLFHIFGIRIPFSFAGVVFAASVVSFPLVLRPIKASMEAIDGRYLMLSRSLGAGSAATFFRIVLPLSRSGIFAGGLLGFARAFGEFGATIMIAGNIPFQTTTIPLAIYTDFHRMGGEAAVGRMIFVCVIVSLLSVFLGEFFRKRHA